MGRVGCWPVDRIRNMESEMVELDCWIVKLTLIWCLFGVVGLVVVVRNVGRKYDSGQCLGVEKGTVPPCVAVWGLLLGLRKTRKGQSVG